MKRRRVWKTNITSIRRNKLVTYGINQEEILKTFTYEEMVFLLLLKRKPSTTEAHMLRAVIVSHCSHGITGQSTLATRMGADTGAPLLNAVLAGFLVGSGPAHQGSLEMAMQELVKAHAFGSPLRYVKKRILSGNRIAGYGHRYHSFDPRARVLMELCNKHNYKGMYVQTAQAIDRILNEKKGVRMNIEAAGGSILLDMGFPASAAPLIILIGRGPMLAAAYLERLRENRTLFPKLVVADMMEDE